MKKLVLVLLGLFVATAQAAETKYTLLSQLVISQDIRGLHLALMTKQLLAIRQKSLWVKRKTDFKFGV